MNSVGHYRAHADLSVTRSKSHPGSVLNSALRREFGRDLDKSVGRFLANSGSAVSQISFMKVLEYPSVVQVQVKLGIGLLRWFLPAKMKQPGVAVPECKLFGVEQWLVAAVSGNRPLQRLVSLEAFVAHSTEHRSPRSNFIHDFGGVLVVPARTEMIRNVLDDFSIGATSFQRLEYLIEPLDSPLCAGKRTFLFQTGSCGQDDVRILARGAEEDFLNHEELELRKRVTYVVRVGIDDAHLFPAKVQRPEFGFLN